MTPFLRFTQCGRQYVDPVMKIVTVIAAGSPLVIREETSQGVKEAFQKLKSLLAKHMKDHEDAAVALKQLEKRPDSKGRQETLKEELEAAGVAEIGRAHV